VRQHLREPVRGPRWPVPPWPCTMVLTRGKAGSAFGTNASQNHEADPLSPPTAAERHRDGQIELVIGSGLRGRRRPTVLRA